MNGGIFPILTTAATRQREAMKVNSITLAPTLAPPCPPPHKTIRGAEQKQDTNDDATRTESPKEESAIIDRQQNFQDLKNKTIWIPTTGCFAVSTIFLLQTIRTSRYIDLSTIILEPVRA